MPSPLIQLGGQFVTGLTLYGTALKINQYTAAQFQRIVMAAAKDYNTSSAAWTVEQTASVAFQGKSTALTACLASARGIFTGLG